MPRLRVEVDRPCVKPGVTFEEREGGRFCHSCNELQHDLRDATQREALALIAAKGGRICGIFRAGPTGEVQFRPETPSRVAQAARGAAMALALAGCGSPSETRPTASPPTSAPVTTTPPATPSAAPPSSVAPPPASVAPISDAALHATDASPDPTQHRAHTHMHEPAAIGDGIGASIGGIGAGHISGGASAFSAEPRGPQAQVHVFADRIAQTGGPGTFDRDVFVQTVRVRQGAVRACYQRELRNDPTLAGEVAIEVTIGSSGAVTSASVVRTSAGLDPIAACAVGVARTFRFDPGPEGGAVTYTVPLTFASTEL